MWYCCRRVNTTSNDQLFRAWSAAASCPWWDTYDHRCLPDTVWEQCCIRHAQGSAGGAGQDRHEDPGLSVTRLTRNRQRRDIVLYNDCHGSTHINSSDIALPLTCKFTMAQLNTVTIVIQRLFHTQHLSILSTVSINIQSASAAKNTSNKLKHKTHWQLHKK